MIQIQKAYSYQCNYMTLEFPNAAAFGSQWIAKGILYQDDILVTIIEQPIPSSILDQWGSDDTFIVNWFCTQNNITYIP
jgi:hypothetical protein